MLGWLSSIAESIGNLAGNIASGIKGFFDGLGDRIVSALSSLGDYILDGIREIFVPDEDFISDRWTEIKNRIDISQPIRLIIDYVTTTITEDTFSEPPKVHINLHASESSKYDYGGMTYCLDMTWYARYKPIVDKWLSAWLWICFIWRVWVRLPNIINGVASDFEVVDNFSSRESIFNQGTKIRRERERKHSVNFRRDQ